MAQDALANTPELQRDLVVTTVLQPLTQASAIIGMPGLRIIDLPAGFSGPIRIPKILDEPSKADPTPHDLDAPGTATDLWKGENERIGEDEENFDEVSLLPPTMESIKLIYRMSSEMARMAYVNVAAIVQADLVRKIRRAMDRQFIAGPGDGVTKPKGLLEAGQGFHTVSVAFDDPGDLYDVVDKLLDADATPSGWLMHPLTLTKTRRWKDTTGQPLLRETDPQGALRPTLAGYPVRTSTLFPKDKAMFADWSTIAYGRDLDVRVTALPERFAEYDQWAMRIVMRVDIKALLPEAVVVATITP